MFITFEGIDCCGKSTQAELLRQRLEEMGREVVMVREPGNTTISEQIRAMLLDKKNTEMTGRTELMLFNAARAQLVDTIIRPALRRGATVISDRFYDSTVAYQAFGRGLDLADVEACNRIATGGLQPKVTFYLRISLDLAHERAAVRGGKKDRMELAGGDFYERVLEGYDYIAEGEPQRFLVVDGAPTPEEVTQHLMSLWRSRAEA